MAHLSDEVLEYLKEAMISREPLVTPVAFKSSALYQCYCCGEEPEIETDGCAVKARTRCPYPDGISLTFELNVPSGIMAVANDLRPDFKILGQYDVNTALGCAKTTKAMAEIGCAHAFVGDSCPGVYRVGPDTFVIASSSYDDETGKDIEISGERVAGIVTDLWWYFIVDGDEYVRRGCEDKYYYVDKVVVRPGVYRFEHFTHLKSFREERGRPIISTRVEWARPPDPVRDYQQEWMNKNFTAGQVIANSIRRYPTLYHGPDAIQRVAEHIFCAYYTGGNWHENGFIQFDPDMKPDDPDAEIPLFDKEYDWYPMCEFSPLWDAAEGKITLNPSFLALARNIIQCILKHGSGKYPANVEIARHCLEGLNKRYPV